MVDYDCRVYEEYPIDRYRKAVYYYQNGIIRDSPGIDAVLKLMITKSKDLPYGTIIEIRTVKSGKVMRKLEKTQRAVAPYGSQWTEYDKVPTGSKTKNYIIRNKTLYEVMGTSINATKVI